MSPVPPFSYRVCVTVNGEFLHYIYPFQFLDSPEWDSLRPSEEGVFQVNLTHKHLKHISVMNNSGMSLQPYTVMPVTHILDS